MHEHVRWLGPVLGRGVVNSSGAAAWANWFLVDWLQSCLEVDGGEHRLLTIALCAGGGRLIADTHMSPQASLAQLALSRASFVCKGHAHS